MKEYMIDLDERLVFRLIDGVYRVISDIEHFKMYVGYEIGYFDTKAVGE
jgi:hypothetical protein